MMAQPQRKELLEDLPEPSPPPATAAKTLNPAARMQPTDLRVHFEPDDIEKEARTVRRWAAISGLAVCGLMGVAAATGHLWAGILTLAGFGAALALLVSWGNWVLDQTVEW